jgi:sulfite exporter TauE/SafE
MDVIGPQETLTLVLLGAVVGVVGQGARAAVGIHKARREASPKELESGEWYETTRLWTSIFIGAVAGALAVIVQFEGLRDVVTSSDQQLGRGILLTFFGAGYAGTDFIEGLLKERLPGYDDDGEGGGDG